MAQEGLAGPWVAWEAVEETEVASPPGDLGAPGETPQEEGMSSTELGTGSVPIRAVETRTSPGGQSVTSARPQSLKDSSLRPSHPQVVTVAEAALAACEVEEAASWTAVVRVECSEGAVVETGGASVVAGAWTEAASAEEDEVALGVHLDL